MKTLEELKAKRDKLDRKIKELENPKFGAGWYKSNCEDLELLLIYWDENQQSKYGFDTKGNWFEDIKYIFDSDYDIPATNEEVEQALSRYYGSRLYYRPEYNDAWTQPNGFGGRRVFKKGKWAEIIKDKVIINGYEMQVDGDIVSFGCAKFNKEWFKVLKDHINDLGIGSYQDRFDRTNMRNWTHTNRAIKSITLDSGVELTIEDLEKIVKKLP